MTDDRKKAVTREKLTLSELLILASMWMLFGFMLWLYLSAFHGTPARLAAEAILQHVLGSCEPIHGGLIDINPEFGHPAGGGWPDFIVWPRFTTMVHQQAYIDWLYRAYQSGLRLVTCLAVNN